MRKKNLKKMLESYKPSDLEDPSFKQRFLSFIDTHQNQCFDRSLAVGHITASAWLVNEDMSKALLIHHIKFNRWLQLGGHCELEDENVLSAAIREAKEESGLLHIEAVEEKIFDIDIHLIPEKGSEKSHYHYDVRFLLQAVKDTENLSEECGRLKWIGINEADFPTKDPSVIRLFLKWKNFLTKGA